MHQWIKNTLLFAGFLSSAAVGTPNIGNNVAREPSEVPTSWIRYAELVQYEMKEALASDDEPTYQFHLYMQNRILNSTEGQPPEPILLKIWVARDGKIEKLDFNSFGDKAADDNLRATLLGRLVSEPPPPDMAQPLLIRLGLDALQDAPPAAAPQASPPIKQAPPTVDPSPKPKKK